MGGFGSPPVIKQQQHEQQQQQRRRQNQIEPIETASGRSGSD